MVVLRLDNIVHGFGEHNLLDNISFNLNAKDRICLIGRNGEGKSTLFEIMTQRLAPQQGSVWLKPGVKMAFLSQILPPPSEETVYHFVSKGLKDIGTLLEQYAHLANAPTKDHDTWLKSLGRLQDELEAKGGWHFYQKIESTLSSLHLDPQVKMKTLSGGWRRRVGLAQALVQSPDILLLDEPTNHLDIDCIHWLESLLSNFQGALLFITHDRSFLKKCAQKILELDRGQLTLWPGDYEQYLRLKDKAQEEEHRHAKEFDKKLAQEEAWIRQGIKARRTRNEGRVRALKALREAYKKRRTQKKGPSFKIEQGETSGQKVIEVKDLSLKYSDKHLIKPFSTIISKTDKIALIGPNGVGKTSLVKLFLKEIEPTSGEVVQGTSLKVAYFDQEKSSLDLNKSVMDNVAQGDDFVYLNGKKQHIIRFLESFLFSPQQARQPARALSGGEQNRLLLAKLFSQDTNFIVLDEPTNDLDIESLELLEDNLVEFKGTVILISHDRSFIDNIATRSLAFEGDGIIRDYVGGYSDWLSQRPMSTVQKSQEKPTSKVVAMSKPKEKVSKKLSYQLQRELDALPGKIESLEQEIEQLQNKINDPEFFKQPSEQSQLDLAKLKSLQDNLEAAFSRWESLDDSG